MVNISNIISVENLGKKYIIGHQTQEKYKTFRDILTQKTKKIAKSLNFLNLFKKNIWHSENSNESEEFWALKDVSFDIKHGDRIGIIGRNGAGKSTLLKILSRITEPTTGKIKIRGRVASLLEVGTGFHPELTGRENIFLNGAILGMKKNEIKQKFDEIVEFAEIEKFLDTPVKRYSSGMYVRLAFAVAAHLEPEILIVDEVLAVGDTQFQKKCMGKMEEVGKEGRTVLFVSHNMDAVLSLCQKGILLKNGKINFFGAASDTVKLYNSFIEKTGYSIENYTRRGGSGGIRLFDISLSNSSGKISDKFNCNENIFINFQFSVNEEYQKEKSVNIGFGIDSVYGKRIYTNTNEWENIEIKTNGNMLKLKCKIPYLPLINDRYLISVSISFGLDTLDYIEHCASFEIISNEQNNNGLNRNSEHGFLKIPCDFQSEN